MYCIVITFVNVQMNIFLSKLSHSRSSFLILLQSFIHSINQSLYQSLYLLYLSISFPLFLFLSPPPPALCFSFLSLICLYIFSLFSLIHSPTHIHSLALLFSHFLFHSFTASLNLSNLHIPIIPVSLYYTHSFTHSFPRVLTHIYLLSVLLSRFCISLVYPTQTVIARNTHIVEIFRTLPIDVKFTVGPAYHWRLKQIYIYIQRS